MAKVYISLGTNLGDKEQNLRTAVQKIEEQVGKVISLSAFYITAPWGFDSEHSFLNAAACVETELSPLEVLQKTQEIERELGRTHKSVGGVYSDRLIDIDLLLYDDLILSVTSPSGCYNCLTGHKTIFVQRGYCYLCEYLCCLYHLNGLIR